MSETDHKTLDGSASSEDEMNAKEERCPLSVRQVKDTGREEKKSRGRLSKAKQLALEAGLKSPMRRHLIPTNAHSTPWTRSGRNKKLLEEDSDEEQSLERTLRARDEHEEENNDNNSLFTQLEKRLVENITREIKREMGKLQQSLQIEINDIKKDMRKKESIWIEERRILTERLSRLEEKREKEENDKKDWRVEIESNIEQIKNGEGNNASITMLPLIKTLQHKLEISERKEKRNNVIIHGMQINKKNIKEEVQSLFKTRMHVDEPIIGVRRIGYPRENFTQTIIVELGSLESKVKLMRQKHTLRGSTIYINDDLTQKERFIQKEITKIAKREEEKGKVVKIGYQKLVINGKSLKWNEQKEKLEEENFRQNRWNAERIGL